MAQREPEDGRRRGEHCDNVWKEAAHHAASRRRVVVGAVAAASLVALAAAAVVLEHGYYGDVGSRAGSVEGIRAPIGLLGVQDRAALKGVLAAVKGGRAKEAKAGKARSKSGHQKLALPSSSTDAKFEGGWSIDKMLKNGLDWDGKKDVKAGHSVIMVLIMHCCIVVIGRLQSVNIYAVMYAFYSCADARADTWRRMPGTTATNCAETSHYDCH